MKIQLDKSFDHGFFLDEQELRRIYEILVQQISKEENISDFDSSFEMKFKNNVVMDKNDINAIFTENNSGVWQIEQLSINICGKDGHSTSTSVFISFTRSDNDFLLTSGSTTYKISGKDRDWVYITGSQLDDRMAKIKKGFFFQHTDKLLKVAMSFMLIALPIFILLSLFISFPKDTTPLLGGMPIFYRTIIAITLSLIIIFLVTFNYCFPRFSFYWGDYVPIYNRKTSIGKAVITIIIIAFVVNIITGIITTFLFNHLP